ncbi:hypothetical protein PoB_003746200 [Plakobranchus ocellatus]|uniref:Uncharacterized protein n=1 Tax=Plakobranchus ocellatus TaxID=259542 RepID=A0AAV4AUF9_9GAST|nr:hypothetical protein PoB_003746200 [Plakobranchus ocellatus]
MRKSEKSHNEPKCRTKSVSRRDSGKPALSLQALDDDDDCSDNVPGDDDDDDDDECTADSSPLIENVCAKPRATVTVLELSGLSCVN